MIFYIFFVTYLYGIRSPIVRPTKVTIITTIEPMKLVHIRVKW